MGCGGGGRCGAGGVGMGECSAAEVGRDRGLPCAEQSLFHLVRVVCGHRRTQHEGVFVTPVPISQLLCCHLRTLTLPYRMGGHPSP